MQETNQAARIRALKAEKNAVILAHLYERPEVQRTADFVGDSLDLSKKARDTEAEVIVFCGVRFMAETAKILNPDKTVLLPVPDAGCPMADMVTPEDVRRLRREHPRAAVVCYINSSAETKAESDICCTSSNAVRVVESLEEDEIIFVPDRNLGSYVARCVPGKKLILFDGCCPIHNRFTASDVSRARAAHPGALLLVHPECMPQVLEQADFTGSTTQIVDCAARSDGRDFLIGTENGVVERLRELCPAKRFYPLRADTVCADMKKTAPEDVLSALEQMRYRIELDGELIRKASGCIDRMLSV